MTRQAKTLSMSWALAQLMSRNVFLFVGLLLLAKEPLFILG
jgi:hypothetical protein